MTSRPLLSLVGAVRMPESPHHDRAGEGLHETIGAKSQQGGTVVSDRKQDRHDPFSHVVRHREQREDQGRSGMGGGQLAGYFAHSASIAEPETPLTASAR